VRDSFRLTGSIKINLNSIQLPRLGKIRAKERTEKFKGRILSATITREADRWYVSLTVEVERDEPTRRDSEVVGVDLGLSCYAAMSDAKKEHSPKPLEKRLKKLKKLSKEHSRKVKGSNNRRKSAMRLARVHRKVRNARKDFLHKLTTRLTKTKSVIVVEDLNVCGMIRNKRLARAISDASWGEFRRQLSYKSSWYGSRVEVEPRFYPSSKLCSECGYQMEKMPLSIREWKCPRCSCIHDRDVNAARNLVTWYEAIKCTASSVGNDACGDCSGGITAEISY
jgi:putative transposase